MKPLLSGFSPILVALLLAPASPLLSAPPHNDTSRFSAPRDDTARAGCGNRAKSNFLSIAGEVQPPPTAPLKDDHEAHTHPQRGPLMAPLDVLQADQEPAAEGAWRSYEVYEPVIERYFISDPSKHELQGNHCSAIAFFKDRWVALWNANLTPDEAKPGRLIHITLLTALSFAPPAALRAGTLTTRGDLTP
jgi:hypothetical protein